MSQNSAEEKSLYLEITVQLKGRLESIKIE
jgi:hypothetical protein